MRRASLISRFACLAGVAAALPALFACLDHPLKPVEYKNEQEDSEGIAISINKDVDILFVIDNSGSMGEEQGNLAAQFDKFIAVLEAEDVDANYRIGVTTTDNGNPWCPTNTTTPEAGALRLSSCQQRLNEFVFSGTNPPTDKTQEACEDICPYKELVLLPTTTDDDSEEKIRPWMENTEGQTNLQGGVLEGPTEDESDDEIVPITTTEAFQCFGPQGINGCGFESHLEAMWKSFVRFETQGDPAYGFLRDTALLSIVFVTDEVDCSFNPDHQTQLFLPEGDKVFWEDPTASAPTSAVCWNAGVECTGESGGTYEECHAANYAPDGSLITDEDAAREGAVLFPLSKYIDDIQAQEDSKKGFNQTQEVLVAAISGVPEGYPTGDEQLNYQEDATGAFGADFGIGPGCSSAVANAVPPVRLREFAEHFEVDGARNLYSVCATDYGPALLGIANAIRDRILPACMPECVKDLDQVTPGVQAECILTQETPRGGTTEKTNIQPCEEGEALPEGADVCYVELTGDALSEECVDQGWNLEFRLVRREGSAPPGGTTVSATCQLSDTPEEDCPNLN